MEYGRRRQEELDGLTFEQEDNFFPREDDRTESVEKKKEKKKKNREDRERERERQAEELLAAGIIGRMRPLDGACCGWNIIIIIVIIMLNELDSKIK